VEVRPGIFGLKSAPTEATFAALKPARITHVINLRRDGEPGFDLDKDTSSVLNLRINYQRLALTLAPSKGDLEILGMILGSLPGGSRVVVYCSDGNRTGAALCFWLVKDKGMKFEAALPLAQQVGLKSPDTEAALRRALGIP
jgi:rhodanese-related sulfurtransferase